MSVLATLKENKPLAIVVGVSLVLTIALIVTLIVLDNHAQKQVDELTEQATGTRAALDLAIQELEACGKLDEFIENVKDIPGAPELLETSGALYGSSAKKRGKKGGKKKISWKTRITDTDERTKVIVSKVDGLEKLIKSMGEAGADTSTLDAEIAELKAKIAKLEKMNAELEKTNADLEQAKKMADTGRGKAIIERREAEKKVNELQSAQKTIDTLKGINEQLGEKHKNQKQKIAELETRIEKLTAERDELQEQVDGLVTAMKNSSEDAFDTIDRTNAVLGAVFAEAIKLIPAGDRKAYLKAVGESAKENRVIVKDSDQAIADVLNADRAERDVGFILNAIAKFPGRDGTDLVSAFNSNNPGDLEHKRYFMDQIVRNYGSEKLKNEWNGLLSDRNWRIDRSFNRLQVTIGSMDPHLLSRAFWANHADERLAEVVRQHKEFRYPPGGFQIGFPALAPRFDFERGKDTERKTKNLAEYDERCKQVQEAFRAAGMNVICGPVNPAPLTSGR